MAFESGTRQLLTQDAASHFMSTLHAGCDPMDLITLRDIDLGFGGDPLLEGLSLRMVERRARVSPGAQRFGQDLAAQSGVDAVICFADGGEIIRQPDDQASPACRKACHGASAAVPGRWSPPGLVIWARFIDEHPPAQ